MTITILDGGMGQELIARTGKTTSLWSVQALLDQPDIVREVHADYFRAGAGIATTNTYSVLPDRLAAHGLSGELESLTRLACQQAVQAREQYGSGRIAGSLGPIGFSYQPDKCPPAAQAADIYHGVCKIQSEYVDLFIGETMSSIEQARGFLMAARQFDKPVWVALSVDDSDGSQLRSGEPLANIGPLLREFNPAAVLINCSIPEAVSTAIPIVHNLGVACGAYANGFTGIAESFSEIGATVDQLSTRTDLDPDAYAKFATSWVDNGATIVGGCCEVGPQHIARLATLFG